MLTPPYPRTELPEFIHEGPLRVGTWEGLFADESHYDRVLEGNGRLVRDTGEHVLTVVRQAVPGSLMLAAWKAGLAEWRPQTDNRSKASGAKRIHERKLDGSYSKTTRIPRSDQVNSGVMGYYDRYPRIPYCRKCAVNEQHPAMWQACLPLMHAVGEVHRLFDPDTYYFLNAMAQKAHPDFVIPGTPYSTVTVNKNYQTAIHKDGKNMAGGNSAMLCIRAGKFKGGVLVLPEYGIGVPLDTGDVVIFNGARTLHGNTFITPLTRNAQRCTLVHYFRKGMLDCGSAAQELERAKNRESEKL